MLGKYEFNRKAIDNFMKSIHPIHKKNKLIGTTTIDSRCSESPVKTIIDMLELSFCKSPSSKSSSKAHIARFSTPLKPRNESNFNSPGTSRYDFMKLKGSPLNLNKRSSTPFTVRVRPRRLVTKLPFVKWNN